MPGLLNAASPIPGVLTAGQPTAAHLARLGEAGYRTIMDLRAAVEHRGYDEAAAARAAGMEYINLPVSAGTLDAALFDRVRAICRDPARRPLLVHCASGSRVAAALLPYLVLDEGQKPERAFEMALALGLQSQELADLAFEYLRTRGVP